MELILRDIIVYLNAMPYIELMAVLFSLAFTILAAKHHISCWYFGFISAILYIHICFEAKLYQDMIISIYYALMAIYGWLEWKGIIYTSKKPKNISNMPKTLFYVFLFIGISGTFISGFLFDQLTDAFLPYFDAFTTVFAFIATWMQVKKYIENWIAFIIVDAVALMVYYYKELYLTSLLYLIYCIICIIAFISWKKNIKTSFGLQ